MIVSALHRFLFVAIPKTGTHSIREALREHLGPEDLEQAGLFVRKQFPIPELAALRHGHLTLAQVRPYLKPEDFDSFFKFCFVRIPFDHAGVMRHFIANPPWANVLFQPQHAFVCGDDGQLLTDYVGRVETMQQSYDEIAARIGIPTAKLEQVNSSGREGYRQYYDASLADGVAKLYARDLELFGYEF
jgi:hypothetical protein